MTPERFKRWLVAIAAGLTLLVPFWPQFQSIAGFIAFNLRVLMLVPFVQHGFMATAMGTAFCLALPWWLPGHFTSARAQSSVRVLGAAFSFTVALALDPSRIGFIFAVFCGFSGPMVGMAVIRQLMACKWLPKPTSLQDGKE